MPTKKKRKRQDSLAEATSRPPKKRRRRDTILDHIGFTTYASRLIYVVAQLRQLVRLHSQEVRKGTPASKRWFFDMIPTFGKEPLVSFLKTENLLPRAVVADQDGKEDDMSSVIITPAGISDFINLNGHLITVKEDGSFALKPEVIDDASARVLKKKPVDSTLQYTLEKLSTLDIDIVDFDDEFQRSELVYAIGVNHSFRRIVLVFRGSVMGNKDWPTNIRCRPIAVKDLANMRTSKYLTKEILNQVAECKIHYGFAQYLFGELAQGKGASQFNSKFDKIVETLQRLYVQTNEKGNRIYERYKLCISGHSLGGALAQILTFALGEQLAAISCRHLSLLSRTLLQQSAMLPLAELCGSSRKRRVSSTFALRIKVILSPSFHLCCMDTPKQVATSMCSKTKS